MGSYLLCIAIDAAAPMLVGIVRPGFIFVICCRIFAFADGARARFPAAQAGAGFRLGVTGVVFAGAGMGAVAVGYPFPVVIQRVQFLIGGVNAPLALAGFVGYPAKPGAGGGFCIMIIQIMVIRIYCAAFKCIRELVVALGTSLIIHGHGHAGGLRL